MPIKCGLCFFRQHDASNASNLSPYSENDYTDDDLVSSLLFTQAYYNLYTFIHTILCISVTSIFYKLFNSDKSLLLRVF